MAGQKLHLGTSQSYTIGDSTSDALITTPLASDAAGCMARVRASSSPYASPAGIDQGRILDVVRMEYIPTKADISLLNASNVNTIRVFQGSGTSLFSDMTGRLNSDSDPEIFKYVNVTLTYLHLNTTISEIIRPYLFKNNNTSTRSAVVNTIIPVLRNAVAAGGLTEYSVVCDETNNPETVVNSNGLVVDVLLKPTQSIQQIKINFTAKTGSQSVAAPGGGGGVGGVSTAASTTSTTTTSTSTPTTGGSSY
jgi:phage tail sheath protein FI